MNEINLTKSEILKTNAVWFLADICYSLLYELDRSLSIKGVGLKREMKHYFKMMLQDLECSRKSFLRFTETVCDLPDKEYEVFTENSEMYRDAFMLFLDRIFENKEQGVKIVALLLSMQGSGIFQDEILKRNDYYCQIYKEIQQKIKK